MAVCLHRGVPIIGLANRYSRYWPFLLNIGISINWLYNRYYYDIITAGDGWFSGGQEAIPYVNTEVST